ncbi:MAG TPA: gamma-glutamyl-gamma-aminobutyrate hydrolase family protein [Limnochorda sp.]
MEAPPLIGITVAFDDGTDLDSLRPHVEIFFLDTAYARAIERAGGLPVLVPICGTQARGQFIERLDGLLFSGGGGYLRTRYRRQQQLPDLAALAPRRFRFERALMRSALAAGMPILGICRGHQMLVRVLGGRIQLALPPGEVNHNVLTVPIGRRAVHPIQIEPGSRLASILGRTSMGVNSLHRQAAQRVVPPLRVAARAPDGVIEAVEDPSHLFLMGLQFHPELLLAEEPRWFRLFTAFIEAARTYRRDREKRADQPASQGIGTAAPEAGVRVLPME